MGTMWSESDIPDWCYVEGGLTFDPAVPPTNEQLGLLQSKSPITYVDKVGGDCSTVVVCRSESASDRTEAIFFTSSGSVLYLMCGLLSAGPGSSAAEY